MPQEKPIKSSSIHFISNQTYDNQNDISKQLYKLTGYFSDDFIHPVKKIGRILEIWSDESIFGDQFCVSLVVNCNTKEVIVNANAQLHQLADSYNLPYFHFTELLGNRKFFKDAKQKQTFINQFIQVLKPLKLSIYVLAQEKSITNKNYDREELSKEDIFHNLFWGSFRELMNDLQSDDIILIHKEQGNNYSDDYTRQIHKSLCMGINCMLSVCFDKYISICKYPQEFSKRNFIKSAVSDFVAYSICKLQEKISKGVPIHKINKNYYMILQIYSECFQIRLLPSLTLTQLLSSKAL